MKSIDKKFKIQGKRFTLTGIFSSKRIPALSGRIMIDICFFLFIFALTPSSSSPFIACPKSSAEIESLFSLQVRPAEPVTIQTFWIKFHERDKFNGFFFETESNERMEKDRVLRSSDPPEDWQRFMEKVMLLDQAKINQDKIINDYLSLSKFPEVFESEVEEIGCLYLALNLNLKEKDNAFESMGFLGEDQEKGKKEEAEGKEEVIRPGFRNIKEKISIYAFLVWLWLVIGVLLYILNEQIKEAERRRRLGL